MSVGFAIAIGAVPFFDLLDEEEETLAARVIEVARGPAVITAMETSRRRLAQGVDAFVRSLPASVRNDASISKAAAYVLVGLADERMLHHPAGGLDRWREKLLEFELYGSALAGQEIVSRARVAAASGSKAEANESAVLVPLYLGVFRAGFEGSLRGDGLALSSLTASLEENVGISRSQEIETITDVRPSRIGLAPVPLGLLGVILWLSSGLGVWLMLPQASLQEAQWMKERIRAGLEVTSAARDALDRSVGPSGLPPLDEIYKALRIGDEDESAQSYESNDLPTTAASDNPERSSF